jgi:hypothetical protein
MLDPLAGIAALDVSANTKANPDERRRIIPLAVLGS